MTDKELNKAINLAIKQAKNAYLEDEIPVGAVLIIPKSDQVNIDEIKKKKYDYVYARNTVEKTNNPFNHAELLVLQKAIKKYNIKHFLNSILLVTLEPCPVCYYAIRKLGIKEIYYLLENKDDGAISKDFAQDRKINTHFIENEEYKNLFYKFFDEFKQTKRSANSKKLINVKHRTRKN